MKQYKIKKKYWARNIEGTFDKLAWTPNWKYCVYKANKYGAVLKTSSSSATLLVNNDIIDYNEVERKRFFYWEDLK